MSLPDFNKLKGILTLRKQAYNITFNKESAQVQRVIKDLAKFCRATTTTFHPDERVHAMLEGRREVFLRIQQHIHLTPDQLLKLLE